MINFFIAFKGAIRGEIELKSEFTKALESYHIHHKVITFITNRPDDWRTPACDHCRNSKTKTRNSDELMLSSSNSERQASSLAVMRRTISNRRLIVESNGIR